MKCTSQEQFKTCLPHHTSKPLYAVIAKEDFSRREGVEAVKKIFCSGFEILTLDGAHCTTLELVNALEEVPMFSPARLLVIDGADALSKEGVKALQDALSTPHPKRVILLSISSITTASALYQLIETHGVYLHLAEEKAWEKEKSADVRVTQELQRLKKTMKPQSKKALIEWAGVDTATLVLELEKLAIYSGNSEEITLEAVEELVLKSRSFDIFQLSDALFEGRANDVFSMAARLISEGDLIALLRGLRSRTQNLLHILDDPQPERRFPWMKGMILTKNREIANRVGKKRLMRGLVAIDKAELKAKDSDQDPKLIFETLLAGILP